MEIDFLKNIEVEETKGKDIVVKSIRFNSDEFYMLQFCKYKNKKFATFVKELIMDAIKRENEIGSNIDKDELTELIRSIVKSEIKDISIAKDETVASIEDKIIEEKLSEEDQAGLDALKGMNMEIDRR